MQVNALGSTYGVEAVLGADACARSKRYTSMNKEHH
jgi:hypothetical protein